jgi:hypothetical protein
MPRKGTKKNKTAMCSGSVFPVKKNKLPFLDQRHIRYAKTIGLLKRNSLFDLK